MKRLYVVWDIVAKAVASVVLVYAGDPAAVRGFGDALGDPKSPYARHVEDFELWCVGELLESVADGDAVLAAPAVVPLSEVVLTGKQWAAMNAPREREPQLALEA